MSWALPVIVCCTIAAANAPDDAPPPAVAQNGVVNAASEMPAEFSGGGIARGSLFRIHAYRLGTQVTTRASHFPLSDTLSGAAVEIHKDDATLRALLVSVSPNDIEAILPSNAPLGIAELVVVRDGTRSEPFQFRIVQSSFGAFYTAEQRWGQGLIRNSEQGSDGAWNGIDDSAQPGRTVTLLGTGLGAEPGSDSSAPHRVSVASAHPDITVGGRPVTKILYAGRSAGGIGMDELAFQVPADAPQGCHVPVQVRFGPIASNFVAMAIHKGGGACTDPGDWIRSASDRITSAGVIIANHADMWFDLEGSGSTRFRVDSAFAKFVEAAPVRGSTDRKLSFPPPGTCTAQEHVTRMLGMLSTLSPLDLIEGVPLDAGEHLTFHGPHDIRTIGKPQGSRLTYGGVLGGNPPVPATNTFPLFLFPGTYAVSGDGPGTGPFEADVEVSNPIRWINRAQIDSVDRSRGVTVRWDAARRDSLILIVAVNANNDTGAFGRALCVVAAQPGEFTVPPAVLTNLPPTRPGPGLPMNTLWVIEVPGHAPKPFRGARLDRLVAFYVSASVRTVSFR